MTKRNSILVSHSLYSNINSRFPGVLFFLSKIKKKATKVLINVYISYLHMSLKSEIFMLMLIDYDRSFC